MPSIVFYINGDRIYALLNMNKSLKYITFYYVVIWTILGMFTSKPNDHWCVNVNKLQIERKSFINLKYWENFIFRQAKPFQSLFMNLFPCKSLHNLVFQYIHDEPVSIWIFLSNFELQKLCVYKPLTVCMLSLFVSPRTFQVLEQDHHLMCWLWINLLHILISCFSI